MTSASGPVMIVATDILRVPRARVGKLFGNVTLPRSVELRSVGAAGAGALLGVFLWVMPIGLITGYSTSSLFYTMAALGAVGVATLYVQPMKGEPLWRWMLLTFQNSGRARRSGRVYLGTHQLSRVAAGPVRIIRSCVDIIPGNFDERGAPRRLTEFSGSVSAREAAAQGFAPGRRLS